jgi:hypothetical protein
MAQTITAETLERGETLVKVLFETGEWPTSALDRLSIDREGFSAFMTHNVSRLRELYPDIDPRHEAAIATLLTHMFFVGVASGRGSGYSTDSGLNT